MIKMKFPKELVEEYGAKAGMLMYVARELSDIPQARMIVKSPNESIDDFLKRADSSSISYPRIYRSSAVAELDGYEGDFLSEVVGDFETERARITNPNYVGPYNSKKSFDAHVKWLVERIE